MILKPCFLDSWAVGQVGHMDFGHRGWRNEWVLALRTVGCRWTTAGENAELPVSSFPGTSTLYPSVETSEHRACDHSN